MTSSKDPRLEQHATTAHRPDPAHALSEHSAARATEVWEPDSVSAAHPSHRLLSHIEAVAAGSLVVAVFVLVLLQVLTRYVFASPLSWTEGAARLCLVWLTFIAAAFVASRSSHIAVDVFDRLLSPQAGRTLRRIVDIVVASVSAFLVYAGITLLAITWHLRLPATDLPTPVLYGAATLGCALIALHALVWAVIAPDEPTADIPEGL